MSSMRTLVAITSLCSLGLFTSCVGLDKPALVATCEKPGGCTRLDSGPDGQPLDLPTALDAAYGVADGSPEDTSPGVHLDGLDGVDTAGAGDGLQTGADVGEISKDTPAGVDMAADALTTTGSDVVDDATENPPPDAGEADAAILSGTCAIADRPAPAGTVCRVASGPCDVVEFCDGVSTACPLDRFLGATEVCRAKAGNCDLEEKCTGASAACPADKVLAKGAVCRAAASVCDVPEYCDGASAACPVDAFAPATTTPCRASTDGNICDPPESCTGTSNTCPADAKYSPPAAAPTGVAVTPGTLLADVAWNAVTGAAGYNVKSSTISKAGYAVRGSPTTSPFTVSPLTAGQTYYLVVSAYFGQPSCESANSAEVSAVSCVATAPTALVATPDKAGRVLLTWTPPIGGAASYSVSRSATSGSGYAVVASGLLTASYTDSPVVPAGGTATLSYVVRANVANCYSPYSVPATAVVCSAPVAPTLTATAGVGQVVLTWTASPGANSYLVQRSIVSGTGYAPIVGGPFSAASATDKGVTGGTTYYYVVSASNGTCSSANSVEKSAVPTAAH